MKTKRILCLLLAVVTVVMALPLTVMAATCTHSYTKKYSYENGNMHSYVSVCSKCGTETSGYGYSGWEDHTFNTSGKCTKCGYSKVCTHSNTTKKYNNLSSTQHEYYTHCNGCGIDYYFTTESHSYSYGSWAKYSTAQHKRTGTCACGATKTEYQNHTLSGGKCTVCGYTSTTECSHASTTKSYTSYSETQHRTVTKCSSCSKQISSAYESHTFSGNTCTKCGYTKTAVAATVSLSASSSAGTLGSAGGEISAEGAPASYTVTASATGCSVTKIVYTQNGKTYTVNGSSVTITASTVNDFYTTTFTAYTSVSGVTATFTVNHKVVRHNVSQVMWECSETAVIRSITGNGMNKTLSTSMTIPSSYEGQSNLSTSQVNTIQNLIGVQDGKTYTVNYTRTITVYTPAEYSSTGVRKDLGTFDGNSSSEIESCLTRWGWSTTTAAAIRQAASSSLSFTTGKAVDCTAVWVNSSTGQQLYTKSFGSGTVFPNASKTVSVAYTAYSGASNYTFEKLTYSGDSSGTSTTSSFSTTYTVSSKPLTVTFYCKPAATTGTISVYVKDKVTNQFLYGATVSGAGKSGTTNVSGGVSFKDIAFGSYTFTASMTGYESNTGTATISSTTTSKQITIYLTPKEEAPAAPTTGDITVYVRDAYTSAVIYNAAVFGCNATKYTSSSGYVTYSGVSFGSYSFTASKSGYISNSTSASISSSTTSKTITIYLTPEADDEPITSTTGDITVYVRDYDTNALLSGVSVSGCSTTKTTNSSGYVSYSGISLGIYSFTASKSGYESGSATVTISTAASSKTATIYLTKTPTPTTGDITVYVRDAESNSVLSGVTVSGCGATKTTSSYGYVSYSGVSFGTYSFTASKSGYVTNSASATISSSTTSKTVTIYLTPEENEPVLPAVGIITVYVRDASTGAVLSGVNVSCDGTTQSTSSAGYAVFSSVSFGSYTVSASKDGYNSNSVTASVSAQSPGTTVTIYLTKKPVPTVGSVKVNVLDKESKDPIWYATVKLGPATSSAPQGKVTFTNTPFNTYTVTASASGYESASTSVTISSTAPDKEITVYLKKKPTTGSITVDILDKESKALISGASVTLDSATVSAPQGRATFTDKPFNTYTVTASASGYESASTTVTISETEQNKKIYVYLSKIKHDVSITANDVNGTVYRGSTIMVAATVTGDSKMDFTPTNPLTVTMKAYQNGTTQIDSQGKTVICPKGESNLVWFSLNVPKSGYSSGNLSVTFEVTPPSSVAETSTTNNQSTKSVATTVLPARSTPAVSMELNAPSDYNGSSYKTQTSPSRSWSVWEWNNGFVKKTYSATLTTSATLTPDSTAVWKKQNTTTKLWTTRSGYGLNTTVKVTLPTLENGMIAGSAKVNAYYPEYNYSTASGKSNMLTLKNGSYALDAMHKTPLWFPDGEYCVKYEIYDVWTPTGVLTATTYGMVYIEGSMYDDYYTDHS